MIVDVSKNILIVGLGLLGGSYAKILKRFGFPVSAITLEQSDIDCRISIDSLRYRSFRSCACGFNTKFAPSVIACAISSAEPLINPL